MGLPGLWDELGDGEVISIADFAAQHFEKNKRPLRVAIDEAGWRFNNLTSYQVAKIRESEPAANPIEKAIFWRIIKLLKLNIQPIFVFDGPHRPWKRGKVAGRIEYDDIRLLVKLLDVLKIPHHRAPAEAEAECAKLQQHGIVDAVWTEDGDALMFGAEVLIRNYRVSVRKSKAKTGSVTEGDIKKVDKRGDTKKSDTHIRIYRSQNMLKTHGLDQYGLILYAILKGGDYNTAGLRGCGEKTALEAARHGLGKVLCEAPQGALEVWRAQLNDFFLSKGKRIDIPPGFPKPLHLNNYKNPKVSTLEKLQDLRGLRHGWHIPMDPPDEVKLRSFLRTRFNIWTKGYLNYIAPVLLVTNLAQTTTDERSSNSRYELQSVGTCKDATSTTMKVTFSPTATTNLDVSVQPDGEEGEDWSKLQAKDGTPFDPTQRVECAVLRCVLQHALPEAAFNALIDESSKPAKRQIQKAKDLTTDINVPAMKRKRSAKDDVPAQQAPKSRKRKSESAQQPTTPPTSHEPVKESRQQISKEALFSNTSSAKNIPVHNKPIDLTMDSDEDNDADLNDPSEISGLGTTSYTSLLPPPTFSPTTSSLPETGSRMADQHTLEQMPEHNFRAVQALSTKAFSEGGDVLANSIMSQPHTVIDEVEMIDLSQL